MFITWSSLEICLFYATNLNTALKCKMHLAVPFYLCKNNRIKNFVNLEHILLISSNEISFKYLVLI